MNKEKEFIFPLNYKEKEKFLGIVEYKTIFVIALICVGLFFAVKNIEMELLPKIVIFIMISGFFSILILIGVNGESMIDFMYFMVKFFIREKIYVYRKTTEKERKNICLNLLKRGFQ